MKALNSFARGDPSPLQDFLGVLAGASLVDLLDQVGTAKDELLSLKKVSKFAPYEPKYLALRCQQGALPAVKQKGEWRTSRRAVELYLKHLSRKTD